MRNSKKNSSRHLRFEGLEDRRLMAGDMVAFMKNGALIIQEAANSVGGNSSIQISNGGTGSGAVIRVQGVTHPDGTVTRIGNENSKNFTAYKDFKVNYGNVFISTGAGSDVVEVMPGTIVYGNLDIKTSTAVAPYANDHDQIFLDQMLPMKSVNIVTGTGDDLVDINTFKRNVNGQRLDINTGFGNDTVLMYGQNPFYNVHGADQGYVRIQTYDDVNNAANDSDTVNVQDCTAISLGILLGGGERDVAAITNTRTPMVAVYGDGGIDSVYASNVYASNYFFASLGAGDDYFSLGEGGVLSNAFDVYGGSGYDTLIRPRYFKYGSTYSSNPYFRIYSGFEYEYWYDTYNYTYAYSTDAVMATWT